MGAVVLFLLGWMVRALCAGVKSHCRGRWYMAYASFYCCKRVKVQFN